MIVKSIISVFTAGVILFSSAFTPVAKAGLVEDLANSYTQSSFAKFVMNGSFVTVGAGIGAYYGSPQIGAMVGEAVALGFNDVVSWYAAGHTDDEVYDAFAQHADSLQTDLGTAILINGGIRIPFTIKTLVVDRESSAQNLVLSPVPAQVVSWSGDMFPSYFSIRVGTDPITIPFNCTYKIHGAGTFVNCALPNTYLNPSLKNGSQGGALTVNNLALTSTAVNDGNRVHYSASYYFYVDMWPAATATLPTSQDITVNSRPTSIVGDYGIIGDDGTIIHVEGNMIVDESTNTVYNPVTDTTYNFTDYAFDYSDRSYTLTLEDGTLLRVVYGDDNITIEEGDTVYIIYYLIPNIPDGDDPGDIPGGEDWSWWKKAWQEFTDKLFGILGNGSTVNPDNVPSVPGDEESGDEGYTIIDLFVVLKDGTWAFITGIVGTAYDGFTSFVESVISAGSFFTFYDEESDEGVLFIPLENGETIWD